MTTLTRPRVNPSFLTRKSPTMFLQIADLRVDREVPVEVLCRGTPVGLYRLDVVVEEKVVVEIKATTSIGIADERQVQNYLRATNLEVGLLLHFGPKPQVRRFAFANSNKPPKTIR